MKAKTLKVFLIVSIVFIVCALALALPVGAEETNELIGDVYADGKINSKDAIFMLQYLAYIVEIDDESLYIANTYVEDNAQDGKIKVNSRDALILLQHLALMDVSLGEGRWQTAKAPTLQEKGSAKRNNAKGFQELVLPTLNETDYSATITKQPVCFDVGEKTYTYILGEERLVFTVNIPKIACNIVVDKAVAPTCTETGLTEGSHCEMCNKIEIAQKTVPALGHTEVKDEAIEATCTSEGKGEGSHCSVCEAIIKKQSVIPMKEHSYSTSDWKCTVCRKNEYIEYTNYSDYYHNCTVTENNGVVTLTYNQSDPVGLNINKFPLDGNKTYVFVFGSNAGKGKIASNGAQYGNVRIKIESRNTPFDLKISNVALINYSTVISSSAPTLNLGFYGATCTLACTKASNGANGAGYGTWEVGNGGNGGSGANGNVAISCSGNLNITCGVAVYITGGSGGDGGNGGNSKSSGSSGGNGGNGGNGAFGIKANEINVSFVNGKTKSDFTVRGGAGGTGGTGGWGSAFLGIGKINRGAAGASGSSALASNVSINYL